MSHTSTISAVVISDINALQRAINELSREGVSVSLLRDAVPRAYFSQQEGMGVADYVVKLGNNAYDIGLYKKADGNGYEARTDFYGGSVERTLGAPAAGAEDREQARMGKLFQRYAVCAAEDQAVAQGFMPSRSTLNDGTIQLQLVAA